MTFSQPSDRNGLSSTRVLNIRTIIDTIRTRGKIGRKEIAKLTHLSVPTVWRVIDDLIEEGIVREVASDSSSKKRGPKTALVDINADAGWVAAIDITEEHIRACAMDLTGKMRDLVGQELVNVVGEASVGPAIVSVLNSLLQKAEANYGKPLCIGVSSVGIIDSTSGVVKLSFNLQLKDFQLARLIQQVCDVPVLVYNDVASSAFAEARLGAGRNCPDFGYVVVGLGIGANYVCGNEVLDYDSKTEFGLMIVAPEGDPERFEGRGFLESLASGRGIASAARRTLEGGADSLMRKLSPGGPAYVTAAIVLEAAKQGDSTAIDVLAKAMNYLAIGIVNVSNILRLKKFVINGSVAEAGEVFWKPLLDSISKYEYWPGDIQLQASELQEDAGLMGAGMLALDRAFGLIAGNRNGG